MSRQRAMSSVPLDEPSLKESAVRLIESGVGAIAVVLLHAYANPAHELRCEELLRGRYPEVSVSLSQRVRRRMARYERTSTTVINGTAVASTVGSYLSELEQRLRGEGLGSAVISCQSNGGMTTARRSAREQPVNTLLSGPVGGAIAAAHAARRANFTRAMAIDMGGTSFERISRRGRRTPAGVRGATRRPPAAAIGHRRPHDRVKAAAPWRGARAAAYGLALAVRAGPGRPATEGEGPSQRSPTPTSSWIA